MSATKTREKSSSITVHLYDPRWKTQIRTCRAMAEKACHATLSEMRYKGKSDISVVLADNALVCELNRDYRGKNKPTNVLSFPNEEDPLGDIILAFETVEAEARQQGKELRHHMLHLLVHGAMHLLGHDHEHDAQAQAMERCEIKILKKLGVNNPYL